MYWKKKYPIYGEGYFCSMQHVKKDSGGVISRMNMKLNKRNCEYMLNNNEYKFVVPNTFTQNLDLNHKLEEFKTQDFMKKID